MVHSFLLRAPPPNAIYFFAPEAPPEQLPGVKRRSAARNPKVDDQ
jgi:hypothetical protein